MSVGTPKTAYCGFNFFKSRRFAPQNRLRRAQFFKSRRFAPQYRLRWFQFFQKPALHPSKPPVALSIFSFFFRKLSFRDSKTPIAISIFSKPVFYASKPPTVLPIFQFFSKAGALRLNTAYDSSHFFKSRPFAPPNRHRRFLFFQKPALRASKPPTTVSNFQSRRFAP